MSFGTALHVMMALAYNDGRHLTSQDLAKSVGVNAVTVRKLIGQLTEAGLVETQPGPGGGARLARSPQRISVDDVFAAVDRPAFVKAHGKEVFDVCPVSTCMPNVFERLNDAIAQKAAPILKKTTLKMLVDEEIPSS
jgi:Rrf2 family protein